MLSLLDWVHWDSYEAYAIPNLDPLLGDRSTAADPADKASSPRGWLDQGNNILASSCSQTTTVNNQFLKFFFFFFLTRPWPVPTVHYHRGQQRHNSAESHRTFSSLSSLSNCKDLFAHSVWEGSELFHLQFPSRWRSGPCLQLFYRFLQRALQLQGSCRC